MSKTIQAYISANPDKFESWHSEDHNERGLDYWVYCKAPYFYPGSECGTIHEDTVKDSMSAMRQVVKGRFDGYGWETV